MLISVKLPRPKSNKVAIGSPPNSPQIETFFLAALALSNTSFIIFMIAHGKRNQCLRNTERVDLVYHRTQPDETTIFDPKTSNEGSGCLNQGCRCPPKFSLYDNRDNIMIGNQFVL